MPFASGYLTPKQVFIWFSRTKGESQAEIGRSLGVQRQGIYEALKIIDSKLNRALMEAAQINKLDIHHVDTVNGILEAYSHAYDIPVVVSFTKSNGVQVWYLYEGRCESCARREACLNLLKAEADERDIKITDEELKLLPSQLGKKIFSSIKKIGV